jgi:hypothetical protein
MAVGSGLEELTDAPAPLAEGEALAPAGIDTLLEKQG